LRLPQPDVPPLASPLVLIEWPSEKIFSQANKPRVPDAVDGIQVNFCKNPTCSNYGVPASVKKQTRGPGARLRGRDRYKVQASNLAIQEEAVLLSEYLNPKEEPSCPKPSCSNHAIGISSGKSHYHSFGKTESGSVRYRCKLCGKTFSVGGATLRQKKPHKNKLIFQLLMNKTPFRRICEVANVEPYTLYAKINFLCQESLAFAASRERRLLEGMPIRRVCRHFQWHEE
jgi:transposase-like protein